MNVLNIMWYKDEAYKNTCLIFVLKQTLLYKTLLSNSPLPILEAHSTGPFPQEQKIKLYIR